MITSNWKTTAASILSALMVTLTTLVAFQAPAALLTPGASKTLLYVTTGATLLASLCRVWIGLLQNDAQPIPVIAQTIQASGGLAATAATAPPVTKVGP